jgi:hypothetical protein
MLPCGVVPCKDLIPHSGESEEEWSAPILPSDDRIAFRWEVV